MKSLLSVLALAFGALTFQSCEVYPTGTTAAAITVAAITETEATMAIVITVEVVTALL